MQDLEPKNWIVQFTMQFTATKVVDSRLCPILDDPIRVGSKVRPLVTCKINGDLYPGLPWITLMVVDDQSFIFGPLHEATESVL